MSNVIKNTVPTIADEKIIPIQYIYSREESVKNNHPPEEKINGETIQKAEEKARNIIASARQEAERIKQIINQEKQALEEEKQRVLAKAEKQGFEAGFLRGEEAGLEQVKNLLEKARAIVKAAEDDYQKTIARSEQTILAIGLAAAEKILHTELKENPERFRSLVQGAMKEATKYNKIYIRVHPDHYPIIVANKDELMPGYFQVEELYIYPDEKLQVTDCIIETEGERIVAGVDTQFEELKIKLFELFSRDSHES